jgi:D-sedoheptulose 7-phosphate isomerase
MKHEHQELIHLRFSELLSVITATLKESGNSIERAALIITESFLLGNKLLICGNGGSAADSQHFAAELLSSFAKGLQRKSLPALSLTTDSSVLTAYSNDYGFDGVFERQISGLGKQNDVLCVISTSGKSQSCIKAAKSARAQGLKVIALTKMNSDLSLLADCAVEVVSNNTQHIQECHILIIHTIVEIIENLIIENGHKND